MRSLWAWFCQWNMARINRRIAYVNTWSAVESTRLSAAYRKWRDRWRKAEGLDDAEAERAARAERGRT